MLSLQSLHLPFFNINLAAREHEARAQHRKMDKIFLKTAGRQMDCPR